METPKEIANFLINDFWRTLQLLRPAYTLRNIGEMQVRQYLTGHESFLNSPLSSLALILGKQDGPAWRRLLNSLNKHSNDVYGKEFGKIDSEDIESANDAVDSFLEFMASKVGSFDKRSYRSGTVQGVAPVEFGHPRYFDGLAWELFKLRKDPVASILAGNIPSEVRDAVNKGADFKQSIVDYFYQGPGKKQMDLLANGRPEARSLFNTREGIELYIFDPVNGVNARLTQSTGNIKALKTLVARGAVKLSNGDELFMGRGPEDAASLSKLLKKNYKNAAELEGNSVVVKLSDSEAGKPKGADYIRKAVDGWFSLNNTLEKNIGFAPEWKQSYWDNIAHIANSLDQNALEELRANAEETLTGLRINGIKVGKDAPQWKALLEAKGNGTLTIDDAHKYAGYKANQHTKELFYDAYNRKSLWHALRFAIPFGQAWADTLVRWGQLSKENPEKVYSVYRLLNEMQSPGSSAIYDLTGVKGYDSNQGILFNDPQTGQRRIFIPFAGTILHTLAKYSSGVDVPNGQLSFNVTADPLSLNFALGAGSVLPGVGPGITLPVSTVLPDNWINSVPPTLRNWIFPFGTPDVSQGPIESYILPSWLKRLTPLFGPGSASEATFASTLRPTMDYLASTGQYDLSNPDDQAKLTKDASDYAKWFGVWRGIMQGISPATPLPQALSKDKTGAAVTQAALYRNWLDILNNNKYDYYAAVNEFFDKFGPENVYAIIYSTKGGTPPTGDAWNFLQKNPSLANKYSNVLGLFYPGGEFSQEFYRYQTRTGQRQVLSKEEISSTASNLLYKAAKSRIELKAADEGWDSGTLQKKLDNLLEDFGGVIPTVKFDPNKTKNQIALIKDALKHPEFANTDAGQAVTDYLYLRDIALQEAQQYGYKGLGSKSMSDSRQWLFDSAQQIIDAHPDFQNMFTQVFSNEVKP